MGQSWRGVLITGKCCDVLQDEQGATAGPHLAAGAAADTHQRWACAGGGGPLTVYIYELSLCTSEGISEATVNLVSFLLWEFCSGVFSCLCVCCVGAFSLQFTSLSGALLVIPFPLLDRACPAVLPGRVPAPGAVAVGMTSGQGKGTHGLLPCPPAPTP